MNPNDESLIMSMAWTYRDSGDTENAITCLESLLEKELARDIFTGFAYDELVKILREKGESDKLIEICEKVVNAQPCDCAFIATLGESYLRGGKVQNAVDVFERITRMEPDSVVYWCFLGNALIAAADFVRAEEAYEKACALDPDEAGSIYFRMADAYLKNGCYQRAEEALCRSIDADCEKPLNHCSLGDIYIKERKLVEAHVSYRRAIEIDPASRAVYLNRLGNALTKEGFNAEAADAFEEAIEEEPDNPFYYLGLFKACEKGGFDDRAREIYRQAIKRKVFN
jgi:tetratricopeptide (TPR) repeat protein